MPKVIELTNRVAPTDAGTFDVRALRRSSIFPRLIGWGLVFVTAFVGAGMAWDATRTEFDEQLRRVKQRLISAELEKMGGATVTEKELKLKLAQAQDENARLRELVGRIAAAIEVER